MAQQTKRGHVYVISNIGSFGDGVYKIGLTRQLDPMVRSWEPGDASVPFDCDVHAMIFSEDAPGLESKLHRHFLLNQVNKVNDRKEFFRTSVADLKREIDALGVDAHQTLLSDARKFRETGAIEAKISEDPAAREAWINRLLVLDPTDSLEKAIDSDPTPDSQLQAAP
ncbi:MAG: GIY-YIG nuclease family protein [Phycisphaerae bacterium]|nr:GIY-YIG nuclease family protein [Phycisphaerae bacterium]